MRISELTDEQLIKIAANRPGWMADNRPGWMADNRPGWMADGDVPDYILQLFD